MIVTTKVIENSNATGCRYCDLALVCHSKDRGGWQNMSEHQIDEVFKEIDNYKTKKLENCPRHNKEQI